MTRPSNAYLPNNGCFWEKTEREASVRASRREFLVFAGQADAEMPIIQRSRQHGRMSERRVRTKSVFQTKLSQQKLRLRFIAERSQRRPARLFVSRVSCGQARRFAHSLPRRVFDAK